MKYALILAAVLAAAVPALAQQHSHGTQKGPNGGVVQDIADVHAELIRSGSTLTVNILNESNKPLTSKGFTGSALIVTGADRETVTLTPSGDSALKGEAKKPIAPNATVTIVLKTASGKSGQAKF
jgi:uncharacterized protein (DUF2147 family)